MAIKYETTVVNADYGQHQWHVVDWNSDQFGEFWCTDEELKEILPQMDPNHNITVYHLFYSPESKWGLTNNGNHSNG